MPDGPWALDLARNYDRSGDDLGSDRPAFERPDMNEVCAVRLSDYAGRISTVSDLTLPRAT